MQEVALGQAEDNPCRTETGVPACPALVPAEKRFPTGEPADKLHRFFDLVDIPPAATAACAAMAAFT